MDVALPGGGVERHQDIHLAVDALVALGADPDVERGGQALDIGRESVLGRHRDPHREERPRKHQVGRLAAGPVYGGRLEREIVDDRLGCAYGRLFFLGEHPVPRSSLPNYSVRPPCIRLPSGDVFGTASGEPVESAGLCGGRSACPNSGPSRHSKSWPGPSSSSSRAPRSCTSRSVSRISRRLRTSSPPPRPPSSPATPTTPRQPVSPRCARVSPRTTPPGSATTSRRRR